MEDFRLDETDSNIVTVDYCAVYCSWQLLWYYYLNSNSGKDKSSHLEFFYQVCHDCMMI